MRLYTTRVPQPVYGALAALGVLLAVVGPFAALYLDRTVLGFTRDDSLHLVLGSLAAGLVLSVYGVVVWVSSNFYRVSSGTVVGAWFEPAHMGSRPHPVTSTGVGANGQVVVSTTVVMVPAWIEDSWTLSVRDSRGHEGSFEVSRSTFDSHPVGSHYSVS